METDGFWIMKRFLRCFGDMWRHIRDIQWRSEENKTSETERLSQGNNLSVSDKKTKKAAQKAATGVPKWTLTIDLSLRRRLLSTTELPGHVEKIGLNFFEKLCQKLCQLFKNLSKNTIYSALTTWKRLNKGWMWIYPYLRRRLSHPFNYAGKLYNNEESVGERIAACLLYHVE